MHRTVLNSTHSNHEEDWPRRTSPRTPSAPPWWGAARRADGGVEERRGEREVEEALGIVHSLDRRLEGDEVGVL